MVEKYYTADQAAEMLHIHPKTIQRYIREGKLRANKVGKGWRITGHDLSLFTEGEEKIAKQIETSSNQGKPKSERVNVSSVIDIDVEDMDEGIRIVNMLTAVLNTKPDEYGTSAMKSQYLPSDLKVRIMLWGSLRFMEAIMSSLSVLTE